MSADIDAIRSRLAAATPGPWWIQDYDDDLIFVVAGEYVSEGEPDLDIEIHLSKDFRSDAEFIANAPNDIATLLKRVERLEAALKDAEDLADHQEYTLSDMCYQILHIARTALAEGDAE